MTIILCFVSFHDSSLSDSESHTLTSRLSPGREDGTGGGRGEEEGRKREEEGRNRGGNASLAAGAEDSALLLKETLTSSEALTSDTMLHQVKLTDSIHSYDLEGKMSIGQCYCFHVSQWLHVSSGCHVTVRCDITAGRG